MLKFFNPFTTYPVAKNMRACRKMESTIVKLILPPLHALLLFMSYIALVNDLKAKVLIVVRGVRNVEELYILFPFTREIILILMVPLIAVYVFKYNKRTFLTLIAMIIAILSYVFSTPFVIPIMALMMIMLISLDRRVVSEPREHFKRIVEAEAIVVTVISTYSIIRYFLYFILGGEMFKDPSWVIVELHMKLITSLQLLNMITYALMPIVTLFSLIKIKEGNDKPSEWLSKKQSLFILLASIMLVIFQSSMIFSPIINPKGLLIGVDTLYYKTCLQRIIWRGPQEVLTLSPARSLYLLLMYAVWYSLRLKPKIVVQLMPLMLFPLLTLSSYFMVLKLTNSHTIAALSSLLLVTSPQITVYTYASFQANILGLAIMYSVIATYYAKNKYAPLWTLITSLLMQFIHPWTAAHVLIFFTLFIFFTRKYKSKYDLTVVIMMLIGIIVGDQLKMLLIGSTTEATADLAERYAKVTIFRAVENVFAFPQTLCRIVTSYCNGFLNYPLSILVLFSQLKTSFQMARFEASWILPLMVMYISPRSYTPRLILNMPTHAFIGLLLSKFRRNKILVTSVITLSMSYSLACITNLT